MSRDTPFVYLKPEERAELLRSSLARWLARQRGTMAVLRPGRFLRDVLRGGNSPVHASVVVEDLKDYCREITDEKGRRWKLTWIERRRRGRRSPGTYMKDVYVFYERVGA
jgi:hypothetical protein